MPSPEITRPPLPPPAIIDAGHHSTKFLKDFIGAESAEAPLKENPARRRLLFKLIDAIRHRITSTPPPEITPYRPVRFFSRRFGTAPGQTLVKEEKELYSK